MTTFCITDDLSWSVSQRPLFFEGNDGKPVRWTERNAVVRDDDGKCLGAVSPLYETVQNTELLNLVMPMVEEGMLKIENMGYLNHGARVFVQAKISQDFQVKGEDYSSYITLLNGHTGNASVSIGVSAYRVICGNTFAMAYKEIGEKFRHKPGVNQKILETSAVVDYVNNAMETYSRQAEKLMATSCNLDTFKQVVSKVFRKPADQVQQLPVLTNLYYKGAGNIGETLYDAFNAITDYSSNRSRKSVEGRMNYTHFGTGRRLGEDAMKTLLTYV